MAHQQWDWTVGEEMPRHTTEKALSHTTVRVSAHYYQRSFLLGCGGNQGRASRVLVTRAGQRVRPDTLPRKIFSQIRGIDILDVILGRGKD